jgi:4-hydroxybenzoate polyprenyltransferase
MVASILRVVRIKNLLIVVVTQYLIRFFIVQPLLLQKGMNLQLSEMHFLFLVLSTVFITAAGYVINDYFDTKTDLINRPETVVVGRTIPRRTAIILHWILNVLGVMFGVIVSFGISKPFLSLVFLFIPGMLWFYSTTYKRQFLIGNIIVSVLTALVPLMVLLFELPKLYEAYWQILIFTPSTFNNVVYWVGGYAIFAFLLTLFREIVKDVEDFEGDIEFGRNTLPVVMGVKNTKMVTAGIILFTIVLLTYLFGAKLNFLPSGEFDYISLLYLLFALVIPMFFLLAKILLADTKKEYHTVSTLSKLVMLSGILYSVVFRFLVA